MAKKQAHPGNHASPLSGERLGQLSLLVVLMGTGFGLLSLAGYNAADPNWLRQGEGVVSNPLGPLGATVGEALYTVLGYGAWALWVPMGLAVMALAGRKVYRPLPWALSLSLYATALGGLHLAFGKDTHSAGGWTGEGIAEVLRGFAGTAGASFFLAGAALLAATVLFHIDWERVARWGIGKAEIGMPIFRRFAFGAGAWAGRHTLQLGAASTRMAAGGVVAGVRGAGHGGKAALGLGSKAVGGVSGIGRRLWSSVTRDEGDWEEDSIGSELSQLADEERESLVSEPLDPSILEDDRTLAASPGALVEVEWYPTVASGPGSEVLEMFPDLRPRNTVVEETPAQAAPQAAPRAKAQVKAQAKPPVSAAPAPPVAPVVVVEVEPTSHPDALSPDDEEESEDPFDGALSGDVPVAAVTPSGDKVVVHHNRYLNARTEDSGEAVAMNADFRLPPLSLLDEVPEQVVGIDPEQLRALGAILEEKLLTFKIGGEVVGVLPGPVVTIFEFRPSAGIKVSRIANLEDDLAMALKATRVRIVAPIPGKDVVGIEIPSAQRLTIYIREVLASKVFRENKMALPCILGKDISGKPLVADLAKMPHLLVGGTTGSGKSVGVNGMLLSMLFSRTPDELRMLLVDPKMLEFSMYEDIPHLLHPVVTEPKVAAAALAWAVKEMDDRYRLLARVGVRNIVNYNNRVEELQTHWNPREARRFMSGELPPGEDPPVPQKMPYIVIVIDELADLMMVAKKEVEESVARIAQKARAAGMHLIVATQRPSADVVTGLIKANLPTRISFQLRTKLDSRIILDVSGAETLLGRGDMLYLATSGDLIRCHGAFIDDPEVQRVTDFLRDQRPPDYIAEIRPLEEEGAAEVNAERDDNYLRAREVVIAAGKASTSMIQRHLKIGYNRAAEIIDQLEADGVIGPADGARPREVLAHD